MAMSEAQALESRAKQLLETRTLQDMGRKVRQAGRLLKSCLDIREATLGADAELVVRTQLELGLCRAKEMQPEEAEHLLRRCLDIGDAKLDPWDMQIANTLRSLASTLSEVGKLEEALGALRRCLAIQESNLGGDDFDVAFTLYRIGQHLQQSGELKEAEEKLLRSLQIQVKGVGHVLKSSLEIPEARTARYSCMLECTHLELRICRRARDHEVCVSTG